MEKLSAALPTLSRKLERSIPELIWSWRRDLNPRPSDYKSDALPAELRQQARVPAQASTLTLIPSSSTGQL